MIYRRLSSLLVLGWVLLFVGCASTKTTNTARSAKEQMLVSNAVDQSLDKVDFTPLYDQKVYLDDKYLECVDKPYILGSVRHRVLRAGGRLQSKPEDAEVIMEVRSGGVGTDSSESFLGTPEIALPGMLTVPEIRLAERKTQYGYSKIGLVTYDAATHKVLGDGGLAMAQADDNNWTFFGVGPYQNGALKRDVGRARRVPAGMYRRELPTTVAFGTRDAYSEEASTQFASESKEQQ